MAEIQSVDAAAQDASTLNDERARRLADRAALYAAVPGLYKPENRTNDATEFRQSLTDNEIQ